MSYSLFPGFVKIQYQGATNIRHVATIGVNPGGVDPFSGKRNVRLKDSSQYNWDAAVTDYVNIIKALVPNAVTFIDSELWVYPSETSDPVFEAYHSLNIAGTGGVPNLGPSNMLTASLRGQNGGLGKLAIMNCIAGANLILRPPNYTSAPYKAWADYVTSATTWIYLRSNSYPQFTARMISKTNDAVRRKILLDS